jgi:hypothetical protein
VITSDIGFCACSTETPGAVGAGGRGQPEPDRDQPVPERQLVRGDDRDRIGDRRRSSERMSRVLLHPKPSLRDVEYEEAPARAYKGTIV